MRKKLKRYIKLKLDYISWKFIDNGLFTLGAVIIHGEPFSNDA